MLSSEMMLSSTTKLCAQLLLHGAGRAQQGSGGCPRAHSLPLVQEGLGHVRVQLHVAGWVLDDVVLQLPLHVGAIQGLLHQPVQAAVAAAEVLAGQSPLVQPVHHLRQT